MYNVRAVETQGAGGQLPSNLKDQLTLLHLMQIMPTTLQIAPFGFSDLPIAM